MAPSRAMRLHKVRICRGGVVHKVPQSAATGKSYILSQWPRKAAGLHSCCDVYLLLTHCLLTVRQVACPLAKAGAFACCILPLGVAVHWQQGCLCRPQSVSKRLVLLACLFNDIP